MFRFSDFCTVILLTDCNFFYLLFLFLFCQHLFCHRNLCVFHIRFLLRRILWFCFLFCCLPRMCISLLLLFFSMEFLLLIRFFSLFTGFLFRFFHFFRVSWFFFLFFFFCFWRFFFFQIFLCCCNIWRSLHIFSTFCPVTCQDRKTFILRHNIICLVFTFIFTDQISQICGQLKIQCIFHTDFNFL